MIIIRIASSEANWSKRSITFNSSEYNKEYWRINVTEVAATTSILVLSKQNNNIAEII